MAGRWRSVVPAVAATVGVAGCGDDLTSIRIKVHADGSGTVKVIFVDTPRDRSVVEEASSGITWSRHVRVTAVAGDLASVASFAVADIMFRGETGDGQGWLEASVPLGDDREWVRAIAPIPAGDRVRLARTFDPEGKLETIGSAVSIVVELPGGVIASGASTQREQISVSHKKNRAVLTVPVDASVPGHDAVVWFVKWGGEP